jgi:predicted MFS family arabinose efflux permease
MLQLIANKICQALDVSRIGLALSCTLFINRLGAMSKMFMPAYLITRLGYDVKSAGTLMALYGIGLLLGSFMTGIATDHWDPKKVAIVSFFGSGISLGMLSIVNQYIYFAVLLTFAGLFDSGARVVNQRLMQTTCERSERATLQGLFRVSNNLAAAMAGIVCGALAAFDFRLVFVFDAVTSFAAAAWIFYSIPRRELDKISPEKSSTEKNSGSTLVIQLPYSDGPFLRFLLATFLVAAAYQTLYFSLGTFITHQYGVGSAIFGMQFALNGFMVVVLQIPMTKFAKNISGSYVAAVGMLLFSIGYLLIPSSKDIAVLFLATVFWTLGELLIFPLIAHEIMRRADGRRSGHYFGFSSAVWCASTIFSPFIVGHVTGDRWIWIVNAIACVIACLFYLWSTLPTSSDSFTKSTITTL